MQTMKEIIRGCFEGGPKDIPDAGFVSFTQIYNRVCEELKSHTIPISEVRNVLLEMMPEENIYFDNNPKSRLYKRRK